MKYFILYAVVFLFHLSAINAKDLPSFIPKCKKDANIDELEKCVIERAVSVLPRLVGNGLPELKLPIIEPFKVVRAEVNAQNLHLIFENIEAFGLKNTQFKKIRFNFKENNVEVFVTLDALSINANYKVDGKLLLFELNASGTGAVNLTDVSADIIQHMEIKNKNGKDYIVLGKTEKMDIKYKNGGIRFNNIFPGNEQLTNEVNQVVNANFNEILKDINPILFEIVRSITIEDYLNHALNAFSIDELFD